MPEYLVSGRMTVAFTNLPVGADSVKTAEELVRDILEGGYIIDNAESYESEIEEITSVKGAPAPEPETVEPETTDMIAEPQKPKSGIAKHDITMDMLRDDGDQYAAIASGFEVTFVEDPDAPDDLCVDLSETDRPWLFSVKPHWFHLTY